MAVSAGARKVAANILLEFATSLTSLNTYITNAVTGLSDTSTSAVIQTAVTKWNTAIANADDYMGITLPSLSADDIFDDIEEEVSAS